MLQQKFPTQSLTEHFDELLSLRETISSYFEENMIMAKDEKVKHNRLSQLSIIASLAAEFGNLDELIVK